MRLISVSCFVTICTPTYNRGYTLSRLYDSLKNQTDFDFEWLVIDDGSIDNTEEIINNICKQKQDFSIRYYKKSNGGKHTAINKALDFAEGKMFFIVDSDDYLVEDAVESIKKWESEIKDSDDFSGVSGNRGYSRSEIIGDSFKGEFIDATALERKKNNIIGDKAEVFYTEILKKYKFPEFDGEKFLTENVVWNKIAFDGYKMRWYNKIIYITEYLDDGLTAKYQFLLSNNPKGFALSVIQDNKFYKRNLIQKNNSYYYYYDAVKNNISISQAASNLHISSIRLRVIYFYYYIKVSLSKLIKRGKK